MDATLFIFAGVLTAYLPSRLISVILHDSNYGGVGSSTVTSTITIPPLSLFPWGVSSLGLSLCLITLSIIEVSPSSWMILIDNDYIPKLHFGSRQNISSSITLLNDDDMSGEDPPKSQQQQDAFGKIVSSWKILHDCFVHKGRLPLATAYSLVLWSMVFMVVFLLPSSVGIYLTRKVCRTRTKAKRNATTNNVNSPLSANPTTPSSNNRTSVVADLEDEKKRSFSRTTSMNRQNHSVTNRNFSGLHKWIGYVPNIMCLYIMRKKDTGPILVLTEHNLHDQQSTRLQWKHFFFFFVEYIYQRRLSLFGSSLGVTIVVLVFGTISPLVIETVPHEPILNPVSITPGAILTVGVAWLTAAGIVLSALINGFGSVSLPYTCLAGMYLEPVHPDAIDEAELERDKLLKSLDDRIREVNTISLQDVSLATNVNSGTASGLFNKNPSKKTGTSSVLMNPNTKHTAFSTSKSFGELGEEITKRRIALMTEVEFLESLLDDINEDIVEMKDSHVVAAQARTFTGRLRTYVGIGFSIILLVRLGSSIWIIGQHHSNNRHSFLLSMTTNSIDLDHPNDLDMVTRALLFMVGHNLVTQENYDTLTQFVAFVLAAFLSYTQVKAFLRTVVATNHRLNAVCRKSFHCSFLTSQRYGASSGRRTINNSNNMSNTNNSNSSGTKEQAVSSTLYVYLHIVAGLMSCYCIAGIVLTKLMLPHRYRASLSYALSSSAASLEVEGEENELKIGNVGVSNGGMVNNNGTKYEHELFHVRWYTANILYLISAAATALILGIVLGIQRQNTRRYLLSPSSFPSPTKIKTANVSNSTTSTSSIVSASSTSNVIAKMTTTICSSTSSEHRTLIDNMDSLDP